MQFRNGNFTLEQIISSFDFLDDLNIGAFSIDISSNSIEKYNKSVCRILELEVNQVSRVSLSEIFSISDSDWRTVIFNLKQNQQQDPIKVAFSRFGKMKHLELVFSLSIDNHICCILRLINVVEDSSVNAIERFEFSKIFDMSPILMYLTSIENDEILEVNVSFCDITNFKKEEIKGRNVVELGLYSHEFYHEYLLNNSIYSHLRNVEAEVFKKNGDKLIGLISSEFININNEKYILFFINDITEKKKAEIALKKSEEAYRILAENTNDIISRHDKQGVFIYASPICKTILGYNSRDLIGKNYLDFIYPDDKILLHGIFSGSALKNQIIRFRFMHNDGHYIWLESNIRIINNLMTGHVSEAFAITRDVTQIIEAENLLIEKEKDKIAFKIKSEFLANLSHEILNPMNIIFGMSNSLLRTPLTSNQQTYIKYLQAASKHLQAILNDILDISRLEAHNVTINPTKFSINNISDDIATVYEEQCRQKGLSFELYLINCQDVSLIGDLSKIRQSIMNLISNAIKFTHKGFVKLKLELIQNDSENILRMIVSDSGIGIKNEDIPKLFQPFTQLDSSTTKEFSGTGIGLSIVNKLVGILNGKTTIKSEIEKGTEILIDIPIEIEACDLTAEGSIAESKPALDQSIRILVAEDDGINQMYLKSFLKEQGWYADGAYNGIQALELFKRNEYQLVLMDGQMPKMDGFEASRKIRELDEQSGKKTIIIAITGYTVRGDRDRFIDAGMDDYISKPVDEDVLLKTIRLHLEKRKNESREL